eukprot:CAMPEP_0195284634 /NCGR_PEP_ID=MMETSP0707-20130614/2769_1 /TAXON_ID=33640 /ORGANISM="Asterionellopsis glacialis, Strain CCMP134" /LENGTH=208 /DNA_ID=CAMNT_0040344009 /DNA_START=32 /DNA_END=658 /DNA_ORIENTATION=-
MTNMMNNSTTDGKQQQQETTTRKAISSSPPSSSHTNEQDHEGRHARFVACLERYGAEGKYPWQKIANELGDDFGWDVRHVQKYAYQYLVTLLSFQDCTNDSITSNHYNNDPVPSCYIPQDEPEDNNTNINIEKSDNDDNDNKLQQEEWSLEETILFDTLLARYYNPMSSMDSSKVGWEDQIAALIPLKTSYQVKQRFDQVYGDADGTM